MKHRTAVEAEGRVGDDQAVVGVAWEERQSEAAADDRSGRNRSIEAEARAQVVVCVLQAACTVVHE